MSTTLDLADLALEANRELAQASALEVMGWASETFGSGRIVRKKGKRGGHVTNVISTWTLTWPSSRARPSPYGRL